MKDKMSYRMKITIIFSILNILLLTVSLIYGIAVMRAEEAGTEIVECFFKHNMPLYCPGCGGSRSLMYLLKFDIIRSFIYYPALPVALALILYLDIIAIIAIIKNDRNVFLKFKAKLILTIPAIIILNFLIRNILLYLGIDYIGDFSGLAAQF